VFSRIGKKWSLRRFYLFATLDDRPQRIPSTLAVATLHLHRCRPPDNNNHSTDYREYCWAVSRRKKESSFRYRDNIVIEYSLEMSALRPVGTRVVEFSRKRSLRFRRHGKAPGHACIFGGEGHFRNIRQHGGRFDRSPRSTPGDGDGTDDERARVFSTVDRTGWYWYGRHRDGVLYCLPWPTRNYGYAGFVFSYRTRYPPVRLS